MEPQEIKTFIVTKREVWHQPVQVEATSEKEAIEIAANGGGENMDSLFEYSHDLGAEHYTVEEE